MEVIYKMASTLKKTSTAKTSNIKDFISVGQSDDMTYRKFSILEKAETGLEMVDHNVIYDYLDELNKISKEVTLTSQDVIDYRFAPDLLAYRIYGTTQLDFVVLAANDMLDPKDFSLSNKTVRLPKASLLRAFLASVYNAEIQYIKNNRSSLNS